MSTDVRPPALGLASTRRCLRTCSTATSTRGLFLQETHTTHAYIDAIIHNIRTASQKNIPHIVDCNLKNDRRIEIIFDTNIPDTAGHWVTIQFPTSPNICSCTTWGKQKQRAKQYCELIKITHKKHILSTFLSLWLTVHQTVHYVQLPTEKLFEMSAHMQ